jgi:RNA-splicing ligase RtcB
MRDGSLICIGKGNASWNCSAPHGAGRLMSRTKAKKTLSMEEFHSQMEGIYSTTVTENTLDESPMAYKRLEDIVDNVKPTVKIAKRILPIYNFKSDEEPRDRWRKRK